MKRTRRIEITRYRRVVTVIQDAKVQAAPATELSTIELPAGEWEVIPRADECESNGVAVILTDELPNSRRWSSFSFREWLRQKF